MKDIMIYALAVGNFLNGNSKKDDAYGFKLSDLERVIEIRSN